MEHIANNEIEKSRIEQETRLRELDLARQREEGNKQNFDITC